MRIYNTLSRKVEEFVPIKSGEVGMYVCGPTPYDKSHIGHARTYIFFDFLRRFLEFKGYEVKLVINLTDIDDKIIKRAKDFESWQVVGDIYSRYFFDMLRRLRIKPPLIFPRVSNHIQEIIELVQMLLDKGYAYVIDDGIYFDTSKFEDYGKLSRVDMKSEKVHRIEPNPNKRNPADFALWKFAKPGEPFWYAPFGKGRPGWHIECSAMSSKYLGKQFDIHGGGADLIFPHHENEIAQSEAAFGVKPWVKYWIHVAYLTINREKMSKSLGNIIGIDELLERFEPEVVRFYLLSAHYRTQLDFTWEKISKAREQWGKIVKAYYEVLQRIENGNFGSRNIKKAIENEEKAMIKALGNDLHTPQAYKHIFSISSEILASEIDEESAKRALSFFKRIDDIFAIIPKPNWTSRERKMAELLAYLREMLRKEKRYDVSDKIREEMKELGVIIEDTPSGPKIKFE